MNKKTDNHYELWEVVSLSDAYTITDKGAACGMERRYDGTQRPIIWPVNSRTGEPSVSLDAVKRVHPIGSIILVAAKDKDGNPLKTPPFEEQMQTMGKAVSPEQIKEWKKEIIRRERREKREAQRKEASARFETERSQTGTETCGTTSRLMSKVAATNSNLICRISRKMQAELEREFDTKFETWLSGQTVIRTESKAA
jgi:hypothetical protein